MTGRKVDVVGVQRGRKHQARNGRTVYEWVMLNLSCGHDQTRPELTGLEARIPKRVTCELCPAVELLK